MNGLDIALLVIFVACVLYFSYKGLIMAAFDFVSIFVSAFLAYSFYPKLAAILRDQTEIFDLLKKIVSKSIGLEDIFKNIVETTDSKLINTLDLPDFLKNFLLENNNSEMMKALGAANIEEYISGYLANILLGLISLILIFILILISMKIISNILDLASRLPVIHTLNKLGGAVFGLIIGVFICSMLVAVMSVFLPAKSYPDIVLLIESSKIARFFYENNVISSIVNNIF